MASFSASPAVLQIDGGAATFIPPRFSGTAAALRITAGRGSFSILADVAKPRIERLQRFEPRNNKGTATLPGTAQVGFREQVVQQLNAEGIEKSFDALIANQTALQNTLNLALEGLAKATAAQERLEITQSWTEPTSVLTANSAGTITIAAHHRNYGNGNKVAVDAGSVSGFTPEQQVSVFYRDAARAGGAVTYETSLLTVAQEGSVHVVGRATIPQAGSPPASGTSPTAPGAVPPTGPEGVSTPEGYEEF